MDQDVINLAKAIRQVESGNRAVIPAEGSKLGGASRYQYARDTWKSVAGKYLGNPNAPITLENENKATYLRIKEWKDKGYTPPQIASMWNAGEGRPDAYKQNWKGVNKYGVKYDTPAYVSKVFNEYQKVKGARTLSNTQSPEQDSVDVQRYNRIEQGLPVAVNPERVEPTLGGTIARDILKTPARLLENVKAIRKTLRGESMEEINKGSESRYFGGRITPIGTRPVENIGDFVENLKESIGAGVEMSSYLPFGSAVTGTAKALRPLAKTTGKEFLKNAGRRILAGGVEGGIGTALFEGGKRMTGEKDRGNFLENVAYGTAGGLGLGLVGAGLSRGVRQARRTLASITGKVPEDIGVEATQRLKGAWTELNDNYKDLRNFRNKQAKYGRSIEDVLTEEVIVPEIKDGKVDVQKLLPEIDTRIQQQAEQITEFAKRFDDVPVPIKDVKDIAEKVIRETPSITATGELKSALSEVARRMEGIQEVYGDTLVPSQLNTIRVQMNQLTKAFGGDVFKQDVADAIADAVREKLDEVIQDDVFRRANAKVGDLINIRKYLQKVDGKQVGGGRFSQAFAGVIGSMIGGEINKGGLPVVGPVLGALGARSVVRGARQYAFGSAGPRTRSILRRMQRKNEIGKEIAEKTTQRKQLLLPARGETAGSRGFNVERKQTKPINLPSKAQSTIDKQEMANIILQKSKKGDVFNLDGKELEITRVLEDGVMVVDNAGNKEFITANDISKAKKVNIQFTEAESEVATEMELSRAGSRVFDNSGIGIEVKAIKSTFPKWIPEDLRSINLFKSVTNKIKENKPIRGSREQRLYDVIKEEVTNRTVRKGDELAKADKVSLAVKANEMSFEDFEKFYNENKAQFKEDVGGDLKKFWEANNFGGEQAFGAIAGLEIDENGELKFNEKNALIGVGGLAVAKKAGLLPKAGSVSDDLMKEARKYKSAEEFVKAQGKPLFHRTDQKFDKFDISLDPDEMGTWFAKSTDAIDEYVNEYPILMERIPTRKLNLITENQLSKIENTKKWLDFNGSPRDFLQNAGYDGINYGDNIQLFDPESVTTTKPQLEEIWKKANQTEKPAIPPKENIVKRLPDLNTNKEISGKDIAGNKFTIKSGEALAVYEMKGNKILVRGEKDITVNKNQFQNIQNQSVSAKAEKFAPELEGLEETIRDIKTLPTKYSQYTLPNGENYREILIKEPIKPIEGELPTGQIINRINGQDYLGKETFKSSHWDEPNVISHLRLNDRTYNGKKLVFMEELQSDWAREARKNGTSDKVKLNWVKSKNGDLNATHKGRELTITPEGSKFYVYEKNGLLGRTANTLEMAKAYAQNHVGFGVPNNPFLKNWQEITIKRALKDAVDNNAKYFAWINGDQTSARYNLATYVDDVKWSDYPSGYKDIFIEGKDAKTIQFKIDEKGEIISGGQSDWKGKKLDEVLGKGLADKIMADESGTLSGEGLKFGGEWANNLYDKQVKNIVEDLTGAKVKEFDLGLPVEKKNNPWQISSGKYTLGDDLTVKNMKVGMEIGQHGKEGYIITDVLGDGKFKAVPKDTWDKAEKIKDFDIRILKEKGTSGYGGKERKLEIEKIKREPISEYLNRTSDFVKSFDISQKTTKQQGIELTPEIKAIIKGESKPLKKPKNPLPYDVAYAMVPLIFLLFQEKQSTA